MFQVVQLKNTHQPVLSSLMNGNQHKKEAESDNKSVIGFLYPIKYLCLWKWINKNQLERQLKRVLTKF